MKPLYSGNFQQQPQMSAIDRFDCIDKIYIFIMKFRISWHAYMNNTKRKLIMSSFSRSPFNYCPLVWMCHSRSMNNKINHLHETCLHIIYSDKTSSFEELCRRRICHHTYKKHRKTCN